MGANSYAANALPFLTAMKQADPMAKIGVPWAFEPSEASGAGVVNSAQWNSTVLTALGANVSFVDTVELPPARLLWLFAGISPDEFLRAGLVADDRIEHRAGVPVGTGREQSSRTAHQHEYEPVRYGSGQWVSRRELAEDLDLLGGQRDRD
jgi:hypothetical protein